MSGAPFSLATVYSGWITAIPLQCCLRHNVAVHACSKTLGPAPSAFIGLRHNTPLITSTSVIPSFQFIRTCKGMEGISSANW